jgi:hypothetical protein
MDRMLLFMAWLGAILVGFVAQMFLPNTPAGRTVAFAAFSVALYPVARVTFFARLPRWRYWMALAVAVTIGWSLDTWRTESRLSPEWNERIAFAVVGAITAGFAYDLWRRGRRRQAR